MEVTLENMLAMLVLLARTVVVFATRATVAPHSHCGPTSLHAVKVVAAVHAAT